MKKGVKYLAALLLALFMLTGCKMENTFGMNISSNGDINLELIKAMDDEMIDAMMDMEGNDNLFGGETENDETPTKKTHTDEERWKYLEDEDDEDDEDDLEGYTRQRYTSDGLKGFKYSQKLGNISSFSASSASSKVNIVDAMADPDGQMILFTKSGDTYTSNMVAKNANEETSSYASYGGTFNYYFSITLPNKPVSSNADKVSTDGKTLSWDISTDKEINVVFTLTGSSSDEKETESDDKKETTNDDKKETSEDKKEEKSKDEEKSSNDDNMILYIIIGGAALLVIIILVVVIIVISNSKKNNNVMQQPVAASTQPTQPTDQQNNNNQQM